MMGDLKVAPTPAAWAGMRGIDGSDADWIVLDTPNLAAVYGSSVNVAVVVVSTVNGDTEWVWLDASGDVRRSAANPDNPSLDLTELRMTGDATNLYLLARFRGLAVDPATNSVPPILRIYFDIDGPAAGSARMHDPSAGLPVDSLLFAPDFRWERGLSLYQPTPSQASPYVAPSTATLTLYTATGTNVSADLSTVRYAHWLTPAASGIEAVVSWDALKGKQNYLGRAVRVGAAVFWNKSVPLGFTTDYLGIFEVGASSAVDVMSPVFDSAASAEGPAGYRTTGTGGTWAEVKDGKLGFAPYVIFGANGNPAAPARPVLKSGSVRVDGVPASWGASPATAGGGLAEVITGRPPVFSWALSEAGPPGTGAVRIQVGRDAAAVTAGSPDVWDAGVSVSTADSAVTYAGPALQAGTTYYWHLLYMDATGTSSGWSPTGRFLALGAAVTLQAGDDLIVDWNNPFNPLAGEVTKLRYVVREAAKRVTLRIYSITGGLVKTLEIERDAAPNAVQSVAWDGRNEEGQVVASGMYLAHMITNPEGTTITKKIVVVK